jgi:hypothetical protein
MEHGLEERKSIVQLLCGKPFDLTGEAKLDYRIRTIEAMVVYCRVREPAHQKRSRSCRDWGILRRARSRWIWGQTRVSFSWSAQVPSVYSVSGILGYPTNREPSASVGPGKHASMSGVSIFDFYLRKRPFLVLTRNVKRFFKVKCISRTMLPPFTTVFSSLDRGWIKWTRSAAVSASLTDQHRHSPLCT